MIEKAHKQILDREFPKQVAAAHLQDSLSLMREFANYGSNLIPRCLISSKKEVKDLVVLGSLLKQFVAMVDGAEVLLSEGAQHAACLQIRALFELHLYIAWMLKEDTDRRARLYYVWNLRKRRYWNNTSIEGTLENAKFAPHFKKYPGSKMLSLPSKMKNAITDEVTQINALLADPSYRELNAEFDKLKPNVLRDVPWYRPFGGVRSIKQMADRLGCSDEYDIGYDQLSGVVHSTGFFKQVVTKEEHVTFEPIRGFADVESSFRNIGNLCFRTYKMVLEYYRPGELAAFDRKYHDEWRSRFMGIKSVVIKSSINTVI